jgi:hypothetical protein
MKKFLSVAVMFLLMYSIAGAQEIKLDELLAKHFKAMGYENLQKANTIVMKGTMIQQDAMPVKIVKMRPDKYLMEFDIQDITAYQAFDGQVAWWTTPWTGNAKPQAMPEDRAKDLRTKADFDGLLVNWQAKGHVVELDGRDTVETSPAYKIKITKKSGGVEYLFVDAANFLLQKRMYYRTLRGQEVPFENFYSDYRAVQGIMFAFTQDTHIGGQPYNSLQLETVELNNPVDPKTFVMPVK